MTGKTAIDLASPYGYVPTAWVCILFIVLFGLSTLIHLGQSIWFRQWWLIPTAVLAGVTEVIGWSGRYWSSQNPLLLDPYLQQIVTTIIAPTPLVAANFIILGRIIQRLGPQYSRLSAKWYTIVFLCFDFIALIIQAIGGASASEAAEDNTNPAEGGHIMLGGIAFQMAGITIYAALAFEFLWRVYANKPVRAIHRPEEMTLVSDDVPTPSEKPTGFHGITKRLKLMIFGLVFSTLVIFIRSVYRTIELADGWTGRIITTQVYFNVLDGAMIVLAMYTLNFFHPGVLLRQD